MYISITSLPPSNLVNRSQSSGSSQLLWPSCRFSNYTGAPPVSSNHQGALKQLFCVKGLVFLNFVQTVRIPLSFTLIPQHADPYSQFIFNLLKSSHALHPTSHLTLDDISNSIPSLLLSCEIALVTPFFLYAFPWAPYKLRSIAASDRNHKPQHYYGGFLGVRALLAAANIFDIFIALARVLMAKVGKRGYVNPAALPVPTYYVPNEYGGVDYRGGDGRQGGGYRSI